MKFRLRTLLTLVTVCGIVAAVILQVHNHREKLRLHRLAFDEAFETVQLLDEDLEAFILKMPEVKEQLQAIDPVNPRINLGHSISSSSYSIGQPRFSRDYHFHWQLDDGSRADGIKILIESALVKGSLEKHVIRLTYAPNELNSIVANWIAEKLKKTSESHVELVPKANQPTTEPQ